MLLLRGSGALQSGGMSPITETPAETAETKKEMGSRLPVRQTARYTWVALPICGDLLWNLSGGDAGRVEDIDVVLGTGDVEAGLGNVVRAAALRVNLEEKILPQGSWWHCQ